MAAYYIFDLSQGLELFFPPSGLIWYIIIFNTLVNKDAVLLNIQAHIPSNLKRMVKILSIGQPLENFNGVALVVDILDQEWLVKRYKESKSARKWGSLSHGRATKQFFLDNLLSILLGIPLFFLTIFISFKVIKYYIRRKKDTVDKKGSHDTEDNGEASENQEKED
jgi:hypothetical protein